MYYILRHIYVYTALSATAAAHVALKSGAYTYSAADIYDIVYTYYIDRRLHVYTDLRARV
jgi:hypothetical protein